MSKTQASKAAKTATSDKTDAKTVAKVSTAAAKTKPASKPVGEPVAAQLADKGAVKAAASEKPAVKTAVKSAPPSESLVGTKPKSSAKVSNQELAQASESAKVTTKELPAQGPAIVGTSRFADRFAPPKPPTRQMNTPVVDTPRPVVKPDPKLANAWKTKSGAELSDAEVLAMPDSEYMSDKQIEFFRAKLTQLKEGLLSNAGETTEHLREDTSIVPDPADRATIEEEHALELRTRDRERKLLKKITQSLTRLDSGDYGYCDETGEPIGLGRLIARPTATLSLEAQQRRELKQKMFGD